MDHSTIPPCEASGPDGCRLVIHPHAPTDSIADLARALDLPVASPLLIDDRSVGPHELLVASGLRIGSTVTTVPPPGTSRCESGRRAGEGSSRTSHPVAGTELGAPTGDVVVAVVVGPACDRRVALSPGRHTVGRASSAVVRVDDPTVELHHGVFDVDVDGSVTFTQLTGAFPASVDGVPCRPGQPVEPGDSLCLGASRLLIGRPDESADSRPVGGGSVVAADRDPWRSVVRRGPVAPGEAGPAPLEVPASPVAHRAPPLTTLVGAGIAAVGAGLLAAVLGQILFALFAAVGAVASLATWAVGALVARRDRRCAVETHRSALVEFEQGLLRAHAAAEREHRDRHRNVVHTLDVIHGDGAGTWARRCAGADTLWVTVGRGTCRWTPPIASDDRRRLSAELLVTVERCERFDDVDVPLALEPSSVVAIHGTPAVADALCRSVLVQLAAAYGPADWEVQVVTDHPDRWGWVDWLPHGRHRPCVVDATDAVALAEALDWTDRDDPDAGRRTVIVLDVAELLTARTGPLRRRLERGDVSCVALVSPHLSVPAIVDRVLEVGDTGAARWIETSDSAWTAAARDIVVSGLSVSTAERAARRLAPLLDPEDDDGTGGLPTSASLGELEPVGADAATVIARRWRHAGRDPAPVARLGVSADGIVDVDLVRDGPHGLVAGTTGSGKSELLRTIVVSLAAQLGPDHVTMILVDYKGGSTFDGCARLPHTVGVVTDLDDGLAERVLVSLDAEVRRRERLLRAERVEDLAAYRRAVDEPLPRLVVVIDEFASLAKELPDFLGTLVGIAQRGRSLGIHLLLATQRPAGVVTDDIRANTNLRIALRLQDRTDADDVVGDPTPSRFPVGTPGRAALRLGPDELVVFQAARSAGPVVPRSGRLRIERPGRVVGAVDGPSVLEQLVQSIEQAAAMVGSARPHRPWIDALPTVIRPVDLGEDRSAIGVLDDPAGQCRRPLVWSPATGSLLLVGAAGSGTTTAAVAAAAACLRTTTAGALHLYVVDAQGEAAWRPFESLAHCGAVVRISEMERLTRLLARLAHELDRRTTDARREPTIVTIIDGFAAVRDALGGVAHGEAARQLDRLLRDGPASGMVCVVTTDGSSAVGVAVPRAATWVFHVADQAVARTAGLRAPTVCAGVPGRLRVVESGLEGQVVFDPSPLRNTPVGGSAVEPSGRPEAVRVLPEVVDVDDLGTFRSPPTSTGASTNRPGELQLLVGLAADDLRPARLVVPVGDHVFIGGAARTGRSTALRQVEAAWRQAHPDQSVIHVDRARPIDPVCAEKRVLVVVDDAERVEDPDGRLAELVARPEVTFAIAARLEAVRVAFGHWTREVVRSRCGLIMTSMGDVDGELLGATLPRRPWIAPRPGLAWMIDQHGQQLVQVAARMPS